MKRMKSILYSTSHLRKEVIDKAIAEIRERGLKARKVDKVAEDGKTFYRIRIYFEKQSDLDRLRNI